MFVAHDLDRAGNIFQLQFHIQVAHGLVDELERVEVFDLAVGGGHEHGAGRAQDDGLDGRTGEHEHKKQRDEAGEKRDVERHAGGEAERRPVLNAVE